jgi:hypothetical protein
MKLALFLALLQASAYAGVTTITSIQDLAQIKAACSDPASVGNQLAPSEIKIFCGEKITEWEQQVGGEISLNTTDFVNSSATTNKPNAGAPLETKSYPSDANKFICYKYLEFSKEANLMKSVTCDEVLAISDLNLFCKETIAEEVAVNPLIYVSTATGRLVDNCLAVNPLTPTPTPFNPGQEPGQQPIRRGRGHR